MQRKHTTKYAAADILPEIARMQARSLYRRLTSIVLSVRASCPIPQRFRRPDKLSAMEGFDISFHRAIRRISIRSTEGQSAGFLISTLYKPRLLMCCCSFSWNVGSCLIPKMYFVLEKMCIRLSRSMSKQTTWYATRGQWRGTRDPGQQHPLMAHCSFIPVRNDVTRPAIPP